MATNLVSLIMQFLTPDMIGRIASALGLDRTNTQTAIGAAVPLRRRHATRRSAKACRSRKAANRRPRQLCQNGR